MKPFQTKPEKGSPLDACSMKSHFPRKWTNEFRLRRRERVGVQGTDFLVFRFHCCPFFKIHFCFVVPSGSEDFRGRRQGWEPRIRL